MGYLNSYTAMVAPHELFSGNKLSSKQISELSKCHIYAITAKPTLYFKENSIKYDDSGLSGVLCHKVDGIEKQIEFEYFPWKLDKEAVSVRCQYPYKEVKSYDAEGNECTYMPASLVGMRLSTLISEKTDLNDYEILYIGQAIGNQGNRNAIDRLSNHSTLQKILARTSYEYPDKEIMIFMYEFEHDRVFSCMDGGAACADSSSKNSERLLNTMYNPPNKRQKIGLIEAALIRYFQPPYNEIYKTKFPSIKHKVLKSCYDLDISGLVVELDCENLNYFLYSKSVNSHYHHLIKIDLFKSIDRASFFSKTGFTALPGVIS